MDFQDWLADLRATGHRLCPASTAVPVDLRGLLPDGRGFHLRCRGVRVTLALYRPGRARWLVPARADTSRPEESVHAWATLPLEAWDDDEPIPGAALTFDSSRPDRQGVWDGGRERGWTGHEAGLLGPTEAADLFQRLLHAVDAAPGLLVPPARTAGSEPARPDAVSWRSFQGV